MDLPEPDGPQTTTTSPVSTASSMPRRTCSLPNHLLTPWNSIAGAIYSITTSVSPGFTAWPGCTRTSTTVPAADALNSFSIFIASMTTRVSPAWTCSPGRTAM